MKRVTTSSLVPGMVVAEDVFSYNNQLIIPKGLILSDKTITKLEFYSIIYVQIEDNVVKLPEESIIDNRSYAERFRESEEFQAFKKNYDEEIDSFRSLINKVVTENAILDVNDIVDNTLSLISDAMANGDVFAMLHNLRTYDDVTYAHSLNVAMICNIFARWLRMSPEEIKLATTCGLLHDIGKILMPEEIITKPAKLTDEEFNIIKKHPQEGYNILRRCNVDEHIANAALMHHERCDGTGYPLKLKGEQIDPYAQMVAIADVYDAITSARCYRDALCPFTAIQIFENEGLQKYDTKCIMTFLDNVVNTYLLNRVRLSNGLEGDVVFINRNKYSSPTIKCGTKFLDLSMEPDISIEEIV